MPACRICGCSDPLPRIEAREMMLGTRHSFTYLECTACGCLQISEVPANLGDYYPKTYYSYTDGSWRPGGRGTVKLALGAIRRLGPTHPLTRLLLHPSRTFREICGWLKPTRTEFHHRVLDVGCGVGVVLKKLQAFGFTDLTGVDPFVDEDHDLGQGAKVYRRALEEQTGAFDLIMAHHAFEHMPNPGQTLRSMARLLAPRGVVLIRIPVAQCAAWNRFRTNWVQLDAPRHLFLHTPKSMEILAHEAGLVISEVLYDSFAFQFYGSRFYELDLPLTDEKTGRFRDPASVFSRAKLAEFASESRRLNREGRGDQACFYLRAEPTQRLGNSAIQEGENWETKDRKKPAIKTA